MAVDLEAATEADMEDTILEADRVVDMVVATEDMISVVVTTSEVDLEADTEETSAVVMILEVVMAAAAAHTEVMISEVETLEVVTEETSEVVTGEISEVATEVMTSAVDTTLEEDMVDMIWEVVMEEDTVVMI